MYKSTSTKYSYTPVKTVLLAGFVAGTLDMLGAITVYALVMQKTTAKRILQSIASGVFGKEAFDGGNQMALYGLLFHFVIAFCFATAYFIVFPYVTFLRRHKVIAGLLYGIFIWLFMNFVVLPISSRQNTPISFSSALIGASLIVFLVGLPISLITHKYYTTKLSSHNDSHRFKTGSLAS